MAIRAPRPEATHGMVLIDIASGDAGNSVVTPFEENFRTEVFKILTTPVRTPVANAFAERWILRSQAQRRFRACRCHTEPALRSELAPGELARIT